MSIFPNTTVTLGVCNGTPIVALLDGADLSVMRTVTLAYSYARSASSDWPVSKAGSFVQTNPSAYPQTVPPGAFTCTLAEANALVAAGVAS